MFDFVRSIGTRLLRLNKLRRAIKVISKEIAYYDFLIGLGLRVSDHQHRDYSNLLSHKHKLVDQYNQLRFSWMNAV